MRLTHIIHEVSASNALQGFFDSIRYDLIQIFGFDVFNQSLLWAKQGPIQCPNVSTTPITGMGCRQCLPLSAVQLKGKHFRKPHCLNGVVDTFKQYNLPETNLFLSAQMAVLSSFFQVIILLRIYNFE